MSWPDKTRTSTCNHLRFASPSSTFTSRYVYVTLLYSMNGKSSATALLSNRMPGQRCRLPGKLPTLRARGADRMPRTRVGAARTVSQCRVWSHFWACAKHNNRLCRTRVTGRQQVCQLLHPCSAAATRNGGRSSLPRTTCCRRTWRRATEPHPLGSAPAGFESAELCFCRR